MRELQRDVLVATTAGGGFGQRLGDLRTGVGGVDLLVDHTDLDGRVDATGDPLVLEGQLFVQGLALGGILLLALVFWLGGRFGGGMSKSEVETIVADYIKANPQIIPEALEAAIVDTARWLVAKKEGPRSTFATLVRLYGRDSRGAITGITLIAGFASTVGWPLSAWMAAAWGWREACLAWAALHLLLGLPLVLLAPVLGLQFDLSANALWLLTLSLLLGTPILSLIGAIGAALTLGVRGGDVLLSLLVLPLYVPALVFGAGAVQAEISGLGASAHLSILAAMSLVAAVFSPWASAASLRIALES